MINLHNIKISVYRGVRDRFGRVMSLYDFLFNVNIGAINTLRSCKDPERRKQIKLSLPQATISGVFYPVRSAENLKQHSGLICVDIDGKDNQHISNFDTLIEDVLSKIDEVMYAAHSVSGRGYFVIIPLKYPHRHKAHFDKLVKVFADMNINVDKACGAVCRLRCQSYDLHQYINLNAKPFAGVYEPPKPPFNFHNSFSESETEEKVAACCREIQQCHIDLTINYDDWMKVGASLSSLGETGRQWFHLVSSMNSSYNQTDCDRKFNNLLRSTRRIGIGTFFFLCKQAGITI